MSERSALERISEILLSDGVEFIVVGGQAEWLFGSARPTFDVDLCYRRTRENLARRIVHRQSSGDVSHAPRAAKIQSIEMHEFRIGSIGNDGRLQELLWLITSDARQKAMKPRGEFGFRHYAAHQVSFHQRR